MKTIYLHLGMPKTGTSYLQSVFAMNSDIYSRYGLMYPDLMNNFIHAKEGSTTSGNGYSIAAAGVDALRATVEPIDIENFFLNLDTNYNYLFSSEWFLGCSHEFFLKIENIVKEKFFVKYIVCVRKPDDLCKSFFLQSLKAHNSVFNIADIDNFHKSQILREVKTLINLILNLPEHKLFVINYDYHKRNLIDPIDKILFKNKISTTDKLSIINPSPNNRQAQILLLASQLNITNFASSMNYLENNADEGLPFSLTDEVISIIYKSLTKEIIAINKLLPKKQSLPKKESVHQRNKNEFYNLLDSNEIKFLDQLVQTKINNEINVRLNELLSFVNKYCPEFEKKDNKILPDDFHPLIYLIKNPDVLKNGVDPIDHYINYGKDEMRIYK